MLSTLFWLWRSLKEEYTTGISYSVDYINMPHDKVYINQPINKLKLEIRSDGLTLLQKKLQSKSIDFDIKAFTINNYNKDSLKVFILTRYALNSLNAELNRGQAKPLEILSISPDTITFELTPVKTKKVPVVANINLEEYLEIQHKVNGPLQIVPDSVRITGPLNVIDSIYMVYTEPIITKVLRDTTLFKTKLAQYNRVNFSVNKVDVTVPIDKFTESSFEVPVQVKHLPDSFILKTFPSSVRIVYQVTLSYFDKVNADIFFPYVDYNEIESEETSELRLYVEPVPSYIQSIKIQPEKVEILREKINAENWSDRRNR